MILTLSESWYKMKSEAHKVVNFKNETFFCKKIMRFVFKMGVFTYLEVLEAFFFKKKIFFYGCTGSSLLNIGSLVVMKGVTV